MTILEMLQDFVEKVQPGLSPGEDYAPCLLLRNAEGKLALVGLDPAFFQSQESKDRCFAHVIPALVEQHDAIEAGLLVSAWTIPQEFLPKREPGGADHDPDGLDLPMPSEHPERVECVAITYYGPDGEVTNAVARYGREPDGRPTLPEEWDVHQPEALTGRIAALGEALQRQRERSE